jgi:phosphoribosyl 1,2-cyclic phosphodiesterase
MEITFYGVRGTVAVPGPETNEFGGNTPCVHIKTKKGYDIVLDAGTGICGLSRKLLATPLGKGQGEISILLSHTHLDHIQGFPFFIPAFIPGNKIRVYGGRVASSSLKSVLEGQLHATFSPICGLANFSASIEITELDSQPVAVDGTTVSYCRMPHRGMDTTAYRIEEDGKALVYMTDVEHQDGQFSEAALRLTKEAHILIHDVYFDTADYAEVRGSGHSSIESAIDLARKAGVKKLVLFHYSPEYTDDKISAMIQRYNDQPDLTIIPAQEGIKLVL